jgi:hypothetical protein
VTLGQVPLEALLFSPANYHSTLLHTYLSTRAGTIGALEVAVRRGYVSPYRSNYKVKYMEDGFFEKLVLAHLVKKFSDFYGNCCVHRILPIVPVLKQILSTPFHPTF